MPRPTELLAEHVACAAVDAPDLREKARVLLVDALALAASATELRQVRTLVAALGSGTGPHRVWATGADTGAAEAILLNGICTHARFQDDTEMSSASHPASFVIPAAVAAAEARGATLGQLLDGIVAGYSAVEWLGADGEVTRDVIARGFRPSPLFGVVAACAGVCRVLALPVEATARALSMAAQVSRGTLQSLGTGGQDWLLHTGAVARDGYLMALAAEAGLLGPTAAFEGEHGFLAVFAGRSTPPARWSTPPDPASVLGVWHKALPTTGDIMAAALAATRLHPLPAAEAVTSVSVTINDLFAGYPGIDRPPPYTTASQAQASGQFVVARCLLNGTVGLADYEDPTDGATIRLADRIKIHGDPDVGYTASVVAVHTPGSELTSRATDLPDTLFFRDPAEAVRAAGELLGDRGRALGRAVLDAAADEPAAEVVRRAAGHVAPA